ncbi:MAG: nucleotidyltransferase domain-containing protein [Candidatus Margulisiibacteriota bacterium]
MAKNELKLIIQKLKTGYKPEKVILFGSLAHGKITNSSDIDLMIVKKTKKDPWTRLREADRFVDHNFPIDILVYTPKEIKQRIKMGDPFVKDIIEKGEIVYEK